MADDISIKKIVTSRRNVIKNIALYTGLSYRTTIITKALGDHRRRQ
ncbi:hypothetical protein [Agriterribacter sp.]|nr:hypothetical protein [Agriterribacter sp.]HRQ18949.1 hypothetical protein [Agriterribacter sp.]